MALLVEGDASTAGSSLHGLCVLHLHVGSVNIYSLDGEVRSKQAWMESTQSGVDAKLFFAYERLLERCIVGVYRSLAIHKGRVYVPIGLRRSGAVKATMHEAGCAGAREGECPVTLEF